MNTSLLRIAGINWRIEEREAEHAGAACLALHGFTGSAAFWSPLAEAMPGVRFVLPDLPGHGGTDAPPLGFAIPSLCGALVAALDRFDLRSADVVGYSMGARIALALAHHAPRRVRRLTLIGGSPGLEAEDERTARRRSDEVWARVLEESGIEGFAARWEAQPLFEGMQDLSDEARQWLQGIRRRHEPKRLAASLRAFGTGVMEPLHAHLPSLSMPVLIVAGERDAKFRAIAEAMRAKLPAARLAIVPGSGHLVPIEQPNELATILLEFLGAGGSGGGGWGGTEGGTPDE